MLAAVCLLAVERAHTAEERCRIQVLTSYPEEFYRPFVERFSADQGISVCVTNKNTIALIRHVREKRRPEPDIVWASSPTAFRALDAAGLLARRPEMVRSASDFAGIEVDDPNGSRFGFALSRIGVMWRPGHDMSIPGAMSDLGLPSYAGTLGLTSPARSGTMHLFVETVLQHYGWEAGWALLSRIGGNAATITARSFGVPEGVAKGRFSFGIGIDFLAQANEGGQRLGFAALSPSIVFPASVAITEHSDQDRGAMAFVDFLRSEAAQNLLLRPNLARIPITPGLWAQVGFEPAQDASAFDTALAARRIAVVSALFDEMITYRYVDLVELWAAVRRFERDQLVMESGTEKALVANLRNLLEAVPVASFMSDAAELEEALSALPLDSDAQPSGSGIALRDSWSRDFDERFRRARELVARIEASGQSRTKEAVQ
ncbi:ABC transporter substrate-binding protein [Sinorhizobium arboris]|uniref:ABC transporter substrate-binding protein n=1 Tax=Sinorhizobium arboris TaxID=76745 RepID=UPI001F19ABC5|nr:substrate-binding domain-containing protein [Sinorhizobium arboris]